MKPLPSNLQSILKGAKDVAFKRTAIDCHMHGCEGCSICNPHKEAAVPKGEPVQSESCEKSGSSRGSVRTYYVWKQWDPKEKKTVSRVRQRKPEWWGKEVKPGFEVGTVRAKTKTEAIRIAKERGLL